MAQTTRPTQTNLFYGTKRMAIWKQENSAKTCKTTFFTRTRASLTTRLLKEGATYVVYENERLKGLKLACNDTPSYGRMQ